MDSKLTVKTTDMAFQLPPPPEGVLLYWLSPDTYGQEALYVPYIYGKVYLRL